MIKIDIPIQHLYKKYIDEKLPISHIAKSYGTSDYYIKKLLIINKIDIRRNSKYSYGFNERFFRIPNTINSYWSGFIAADGCVYKTKGQNCLNIFISYKDIQHLERFKEDIGFSGDIKIIDRENSGRNLKGCRITSSKMCRINIFSDSICNDLFSNYNITPKKSLTLQPPPQLCDRDIIAYIAGLIDGDGCIAKNKKSYSIYIIGTKQILKWCLSNINRILGEQNSVSIKKPKGKKMYRMVLSKKNTLIKMYDLVNNFNIPKLSRKWEKLNYLKTS